MIKVVEDALRHDTHLDQSLLLVKHDHMITHMLPDAPERDSCIALAAGACPTAQIPTDKCVPAPQKAPDLSGDTILDSGGMKVRDQIPTQIPAKDGRAKASMESEISSGQPQRQLDAQQVVILLQAFHTITDAALAHQPLEEVLHRLLVPVQSSFAVECAAVLLANAQEGTGADNDALVIRASVGPEDEPASTWCMQAGRDIAGRIAQTRSPLVVDSTRKVEGVRSRLRTHVRSLLGVPLLDGSHLLGVLLVATVTPRHFTPDETVLLQILADRMARTVAHAQRDAAEHAARQKAEEAVRLRDYVLAQTSHDLRSPLALIAGRSGLIQLELAQDQPVERAWLQSQMAHIDSAVQRMVSAIDDLTDIARLQMGEPLPLDTTEIDLGLLVQEVVAEYLARASTQPISVATPAQAVPLRGDRMRLARVLHNLIGNAVKYSPERTPVDVRLSRTSATALITIQDHGVGIPAAELARVGTRFFRASTAAGMKGMGIGLAGSKAIVEQHGGALLLESVEGAGTTVTVRLPVIAA